MQYYFAIFISYPCDIKGDSPLPKLSWRILSVVSKYIMSLVGSAERRDCSRIVLSILLGSDCEYHQTDTHLLRYNYWCMFMVEKSRIKGSLTQANVIPVKKFVLLLMTLINLSAWPCFLYTQRRNGRMFKPLYLCGDRSREKSVFVLHLVVKNG